MASGGCCLRTARLAFAEGGWNMPIAQTLQNYLTEKHAEYDLVAHEPTNSSTRTAEACHIPGDRLAKAVLLRDEMGYAVAVLPASRHIRLSDLKAQFGDDVRLA